MKRWLIVVCCALPLLPACNGGSSGGGGSIQSVPIIGSGVMVTETRSLPHFDGIDLGAVAGVEVTQGGSQSVRIEADDNIIDHIRTRVSGGMLTIDADADYDTVRGVRLLIDATEVRTLLLTGVGKITAGNISFSGTLRATQTGVGTISISGTADALEAKLAGVGKIEAENLLARRSTILLSGTGDCRTTATDELYVTISGRGDVYYAGNPPTVRSTVTGAGRLIPL